MHFHIHSGGCWHALAVCDHRTGHWSSVPCHMGFFSIVQLTILLLVFPRVRAPREKETEQESLKKSQSSCTLISGMTFQYFCHILFVKSGSLSPALREGVTQDREYHAAEITRGHCRGCLSQQEMFWFGFHCCSLERLAYRRHSKYLFSEWMNFCGNATSVLSYVYRVFEIWENLT